jgi:hypothetical protein
LIVNTTITEPCLIPRISTSFAVVPSLSALAIPVLNAVASVSVQPSTFPCNRKEISGTLIVTLSGGSDGGDGGGGDGGGEGGGFGGGGASPQDVCPTSPKVPEPLAHGVGVTVPALGQLVSTGHNTHVLESLAAVAVLNIPAGHLVQSSSETAAVVSPNVPAGHELQALTLPKLYVPFAQSYCAVAELVSLQYRPGGQNEQCV